MKVGSLVICNCESNSVWYKGRVGTLIGFDHFGKFNSEKGDPVVMYPEGSIRLSRKNLEIISNEDR